MFGLHRTHIARKLLLAALFSLVAALLTSYVPVSRPGAITNAPAPLPIYEAPSSPIQAHLKIDRAPVLGAQAVVTCDLTTILDAPGTTAKIELPSDVQVVQGAVDWQGDLNPGQAAQMRAVIRFTSPGDKSIFCRANRPVSAAEKWGGMDALYLNTTLNSAQMGFSTATSGRRIYQGALQTPTGSVRVKDAGETVTELSSIPNESVPAVYPGQRPSAPEQPLAGGSATVSGSWRYYDRNNVLTSDESVVEVINATTRAHLAFCWTAQGTGAFSCGPFTNPGSEGIYVAWYAWMKYSPNNDIYAITGAGPGNTNDMSNAFAVLSPAFTLIDGTNNVGGLVIPDNLAVERAFWLISDLNKAYRYVWNVGAHESPQETPGSATVQWQLDSTVGTYYLPGENIHLVGVDPLSKDVAIHEYGHNVMFNIYGNYFPTNDCGDPHYMKVAYGPHCSWTEGWANFFALAVNNDSVFHWPDNSFLDLEAPTWNTSNFAQGDLVEGRVAGALWDILDNVNDGDDTYSDGGFTNIWDTIYHQNDDTFHDFWYGWQNQGHNNSSWGPVMDMYQNTIEYRVYTPNDDFANAKVIPGSSISYNQGGISTWAATTQGKDPTVVCGSAAYPRQSRSVWWKYTPVSTAKFTFDTLSELTDYNTVLALYTGSWGALTSQACNDDANGTNKSALSMNLTAGTTYFIEATAYGDTPGNHVDLRMCPVLPGPTTSGPSGGTILNDTTPTFSWYAKDQAARYDLQIASDPEFKNILQYIPNINGTFWTILDPLPDGLKYWRIRGRYQDSACDAPGEWGDYAYFIVDTTGPTGTLKINGGADFTNLPDVTLSPTWSDSGAGIDLMAFENDNGDMSGWLPYSVSAPWKLSSGDGVKYVFLTLMDKAGNVGGLTPRIYDTITLDTTPPESTLGAAVTPGAVSFNITWSGTDALTGVVKYDVQFRVGQNGAWTDWQKGVTAKSAVFGQGNPVTVVVGQAYYFRVRGYDGAGNLETFAGGDGNASIVYEACPIPGAPVPVSPENGLPTNGSTPTFTWSAVTEATGYDFQIASDKDFKTVVQNMPNITGTTYTTPLTDGTFYWHARTRYHKGTCDSSSVWSTPWNITIDTAAPETTLTVSMVPGTLAFNAAWSGKDTLSGLQKFDVQYRVGKDGAWLDWMVGVTQTSDVFGPVSPAQVVEGQTYYFRVRGYDAAGNVETFTGGDGDASILVIKEDPVLINVYLPLTLR